MALNSEMHQAYLDMPIESALMPELMGLPYWARMTHEIMYEVNPEMMSRLASSGELENYLRKQQERLKEEAMALERQWKKMNPLSEELQHNIVEAASWHNHCKLACREILIADLHKSLSELAEVKD